jgi:hypothetical protein
VPLSGSNRVQTLCICRWLLAMFVLFVSRKSFTRQGRSMKLNWRKMNLMCSMSVHYIIQKTLNTNKCTRSFFVNYNTLLHVSTRLGHLQGETLRCRYTRLYYRVERKCAIDCALRRLWRRELSVVSACITFSYVSLR